MAFSLSWSTITQTGTDTDLSGISAIAGVTTTDYDTVISYDIGNLRLVVSGTLTIAQDGTREQLLFRGDVWHNSTDIEVTWTLNIGTFQANPLDYSYQDYIPALRESLDANQWVFSDSNGFTNDWEWQVWARAWLWNNNGTINCYARVVTVFSWWFSVASTTNIQYSFRINHRFSYAYGANFTVNQSSFNNWNFVAGGDYTLDGWIPWNSVSLVGISNSTPAWQTYNVRNVPDITWRNIIAGWRSSSPSSLTIYTNVLKGTDQIFTVLAWRQRETEFRREVRLEAKDSLGSPVTTAKVFYVWSVWTESVNNVDGSGIYDFTFTYATRSATGGSILPYNFFTTNADTTDDLINVRAIDYNFSIAESIGVSLRWIDRLPNSIPALLPDFSITEPSKVIVDWYTSIDNQNEFYDRAKSFLFDNYQWESSTIVSINWSQIDLWSFDLNIDDTAPIALDVVWNLITINSSLYTWDITTTWTVSLIWWAVVNGTITDSWGTTINLITNVSITLNPWSNNSVLVLDGTDTVENYSTGLSWTFNYQFSWDWSQIYKFVIKKPWYRQVVLNQNSVAWSFTLDWTSDQDLQPDWTPMYTWATSSLLTVSWFADGSRVNLDIWNWSVSSSAAYSETEDFLSTQTGMEYLFNWWWRVSIAVLPWWNYFFMENNVRIRRASPWDVNAQLSAFAISTDWQVVDWVNWWVLFLSTTDSDKISAHQWGSVFIDTWSSFSWTTFPVGTSLQPVNNLADAISIAESLWLTRLILKSDISFSQDVEWYTIESVWDFKTVTFTGASTEWNTFNKVKITGTQNGMSYFNTCTIDDVASLSWEFEFCNFDQWVSSIDTSATEIMFANCRSRVAWTGRPELNLTWATNLEVNIRNYSWWLILTNTTSPTVNISFDGNPATLTLESTNTAWSIKVRGNTELVDNWSTISINNDWINPLNKIAPTKTDVIAASQI